MTFRQFAINNVFRNKRLYAAYFLSSLMTVAVFFTFAIFAFHPSLTDEEMNSNVLQGLSVAGGIIYIFSFFFILYSMSSFLQSRKKEFGVLLMHGMSNTQIRLMVFLENMLIGLFATVMGILLGLVFSKLILLIAENVLVMDGQLRFYFPTMPIIITFASFTILFLVISISVTFILRTSKLIQLIKGDKMGKSEPKFSILLVLLAILTLASGYIIAMTVTGIYVVMALIPVVILVTIGTYLLFTQLSVFIIRKLKSSRKIFWKNTNMILFSDLAYRMKDNARSFFMVAIISTVAFSAIGTLFGLNSYLTKGLTEANPTSYSYSPNSETSRDEIEQSIDLIESTLAKYNLSYDKTEITLHYFLQEENGTPILISTVDDYNKYAKFIGEKPIELSDNEIIPVKKSTRTIEGPGVQGNAIDDITLADGSKMDVNQANADLAKPDVLPELYPYLIVSDRIFAKLADPVKVEQVYDWQVINGKEDHIIEAGEEINNELDYFIAVDLLVHTINKVYAPIMFVGLFIGVIFFVSAGSFLYFRLYMDLDDDKAKFSSINKIGLTTEELKKVISRQTAILFFTPIIVAILHGAVALTALSHMFNYNLIRESTIVLGSFFIIQVFYYIIVRYFYTKQIKQAVK